MSAAAIEMNLPSPPPFAVVALIGAGQLGTRYLQGLVRCEVPLGIWVVDPRPAAAALAQERWREAGGESSPHLLHLVRNIAQIPKSLDLAMVTTTADVRQSVVEEVAGHASVRYWVLEKVLAQSCLQIDALEQAIAGADGCWVNTPRRMMQWHRLLASTFADSRPLRMRAVGQSWGMACNAVHYLDLAAWWSDAVLVEVDTSGLDAEWSDSKRPGFFEVHGSLSARYSNGSTLVLDSLPQGPGFSMFVDTPAGKWHIDEAKGRATGPAGKCIEGRMEFQSEISGHLVDRILAGRGASLPTFAASAAVHRPFLRSMLAHWNAARGTDDKYVPVT